jgi:hypothetical protein
LRDVGERFDGRRDVGRRNAEITMPAAHLECEQAPLGQAREMSAGRRRRQSRDHRQFAGGAGAAVHQRPQHGCAAGIGEQRANAAQAWEMVLVVGERGGHRVSPGAAREAPCSPL